ncbi:sensor histidine kinase [Pseudonocardia acaciae]|uniref:sensor histidine kinase n=1 Tax=Pseudonocardia acaciae TaxID=551276 RepID=UPI00048ECE37|nr:sensor histidine kinase KdpD [Pseudonocardia acaciae]
MSYERPGRRGRLRIYLGSAPGVGKTYAMLGEGRRRAERGTDVVVGIVEAHGRPKTEALLEGLELMPRRKLTYRDNQFEELDIAAVLARRPRVALVDELAHTNVPGSVHEKRWQDIDDLLDAGIDVLSTVNVQHLESLNDVVEKITGVRQRETVPDEWVRGAEQIELVDITPEALRRRMAHGNIYPPEKVDAALSNYFKPVNLVALRELALLWVADEVDVALRRYRAEQQVTDVWEARERVVVAVTGGPESETVIRRAARIAKRAGGDGDRADLMCVHVLRGDGLAGAPPGALARLRRLADDVGASFHTVVGGEDVPAALLDFARGANATQLVLGTSRRSRLARLFNQGIGASVVQDSGPIDVHMVTHAEAGGGSRRWVPRSPLSFTRRTVGWLLSVLAPAVATAAGVFLDGVIGLSTDVVLFFLATVLVALVGGLGPALLAAVAGGLMLNWFLTPPLYTFTIAERENVITLSVMMVVAVAVALVVDRAARRAEQAAAARTEAALLASFARTVLTRTDPLPRLLEKVSEAFGLRSVAVLERSSEAPSGWRYAACVGPPDCLRPEDAEVDVAVDPDVHLIGQGRPLAAADRRVLETVGGQALLALRSQRMAAEAAEAHRKVEGAELRSALLSAVGHDLRTPLTSIKAAAGSLRDPELALSDADRAELLATVEESVDRLTALVDNLLDSSRLAAGAVVPLPKPVGYDEVVALALAGVEGARRVRVEIDERLPAVLADAGLLERVVANVVDNALRHGRGAPIAVRASAHADRVELRVVDSGPGVPANAVDDLFTPFQRLGDRDATSGVGLGLSVARGFTTAMGGTLTAEDTPGGGLTVVISLPAVTSPEPAEPAPGVYT